ncbi:MAG TPA: hypothetical protein PK095_00705 [Myxococcota bacterium]|nr:hypothetical protein [Myxococcota bacterium]
MTRLLPVLAMLALLVRSSVAYTAEPRALCEAVEGEAPCYLERGKRAPYGGELWPSAFARAVLEDRERGRQAEAKLREASANLEAEKRGRAADQREAAKVLAASESARVKTEALASSLVEPPPFFERPAFLIPVTVVATLVAVGAVAYALR